MLRAFLVTIALLGASGCSDTTGSDPTGPPPTSGTGGFVPGTGGFPVGGSPPAAGGASTGGLPQSTGGTPDVPPGQLRCGTKLCQAGGHCTASGQCPGALGDCFTHTAGFDTCSVYCRSKALECAAEACGPDGKSFEPMGFTWVSYPAARSAECSTASDPEQSAPDACTTPIWLSPAKPLDDVVRCCCR